jgi:hypothetical protein
MWRWLVLWAMSALATACHGQELPESATTKEAVAIIRGLRERQLFELANQFADQLRRAETIDQIGASTILGEHIRTLIAQAIALSGQPREAMFEEARRLAGEFTRHHSDHPRIVLLHVQSALIDYAQANLLGQEIAAEIADDHDSPRAQELFRFAIIKLEQAEKEVERQIPLALSRTGQDGQLNAAQLTNLRNQIRFRIASINLAKAQLFATGDKLNRLNALQQVLERLDEVVSQSNPDFSLWWDSQLAKAECYRLLEKAEAWEQLMSSLPMDQLSADSTQKLLTERVLMAAVRATPDWAERSAPSLIGQVRALSNPTPELQMALLKLSLQMATLPGAEKTKWQAMATELVNEIETRHGPYWGRRGEILLVGSVQPNSADPSSASDFQLLIRQAEIAFRKRQFDDAANAFLKAASFAATSNWTDKELIAAGRAAQSFEMVGQHQRAAELLFQQADKWPDSEQAPAWHLRGCWNLAQLTGAEMQQEFRLRLHQHKDRWTKSETANQARLWLGHSYLAASHWQRAFESYVEFDTLHEPPSRPGALDPASESMAFAITAARRWIGESQKANESADARNAVIQAFYNKLAHLTCQPPSELPWRPADRQSLAGLLEFGLPNAAVEPSRALDWIAAATAGVDESSPWHTEALTWRCVALAVQIAQGEARQPELSRLIELLPNQEPVMSRILHEWKRNLNSREYAAISAAVFQLADRALKAPGVENNNSWRIERAIAQLHVDPQTALPELATLSESHPNHINLQLAYSRGLTNQGEDVNLAIRQWRRLAKKLKPGTDFWFEAKYHIALLLEKSEQRAEAKALLQYIQAIPPGWQQSAWKSQMDELLSRLSKH